MQQLLALIVFLETIICLAILMMTSLSPIADVSAYALFVSSYADI